MFDICVEDRGLSYPDLFVKIVRFQLCYLSMRWNPCELSYLELYYSACGGDISTLAIRSAMKSGCRKSSPQLLQFEGRAMQDSVWFVPYLQLQKNALSTGKNLILQFICVLGGISSLLNLDTPTTMQQFSRVSGLLRLLQCHRFAMVCREICCVQSFKSSLGTPNIDIRQYILQLYFLGRMRARGDDDGRFWKENAKKVFFALRIAHSDEGGVCCLPRNQCSICRKC